MELITSDQRAQFLRNGEFTARSEMHDPFPVVKLFTPDAQAIWLIAELDPHDPDIVFGLCDLGLGCPELGTVRVSELEALRGPSGLPVERDLYFKADRSLSAYASQARREGVIRT